MTENNLSESNEDSASEDIPENPPPEIPLTGEPTIYRFSFTGTTGEYFRIWIVNLFLTIITLGVYLAWAKVRQRKYLYGNTWLDNDNFGFHGRPVAILTGYFIIFVGLILYSQGGYLNVFIPFTVLLIFFILYPFLAYKAIRFRARYSSYRNIRFHFMGELHAAYARYLGWALLIPFTFGLIIPYIAYLKKEYLVNFMLFGRRPFWFHGEAGHFFPAYIIGGVIMVSGYVLAFLGLFTLVYPSILSPQDGAETSNTKWVVATVFIYAVIMVAFFALFKYVLLVPLP